MRYLVFLLPAALLMAQTPAAQKKTASSKPLTAAAAPVTNFHETGSPNAPITMEVYADYQCPACRAFFMDVLPSVTTDFIATGKVRFIHRDFPLQMHQFSRVAVKYANAAGQIGKYDVVANQLFVTQAEWEQNGNIDAQLSKVISPADLEKIKTIMKTDTHLDDSVTRDVAMGNQDHLTQTPTIVIVSKGKRDVIGGGVAYPILKAYLNQKLGQ
jgi:protein-disulfide isomerase